MQYTSGNKNPEVEESRDKNRFQFLFSVGAAFVLLASLAWMSYALQTEGPRDMSSSAKISPTPGGFQVDFGSPVHLSEIVYQGDYEGDFEVFDSSGGIPEALSLINAAIAKQPDNATLLDSRGLIFLKANNPQDAIPDFEKAVEITCEGPIHLLHLAYSQMKNGDNDSALTTFDKVRPLLAARTDRLMDEDRGMFDDLEMSLGSGL